MMNNEEHTHHLSVLPVAEQDDNVLFNAAAPLLNAIAQIRLSATHDDPAGLHQQLREEVHLFETRCKQNNISFEMLVGARYCLCSALDEAATRTPWGASSLWSGSGLLVTFHNEIWGGEKFFQLLARISNNPEHYLWLMEIIQYCLLLGYEGRYRNMDNGKKQCKLILFRLSQLITDTRLKPPSILTEVKNESASAERIWRPLLSIKQAVILTIIIAGLIYGFLAWQLDKKTETLLRQIDNVYLSPDVRSEHYSDVVTTMISHQSSSSAHSTALQGSVG